MNAITQLAQFEAQFSRGRRLLSPRAARALVLLLVAASAVAGLLFDDGAACRQAVSAAGPDLTRLLRMMAVLKAGIAAGASAAVLWRLGAAVTPVRLAAYAVACGATAAGPMLIWHMAHVGTGAALLHGGLLAAVVLLGRDPAVASRLAAVAAARGRPGLLRARQ